MTRRVRATVLARDEETCQWCGANLSSAIPQGLYSLQHRRARGMGGSKAPDTDQPSNLVTLCGSGTTRCHGYVESHRDEARERGFTLWQTDDPAAVGLHAHDGPWFLNADGTRDRA